MYNQIHVINAGSAQQTTSGYGSVTEVSWRVAVVVFECVSVCSHKLTWHPELCWQVHTLDTVVVVGGLKALKCCWNNNKGDKNGNTDINSNNQLPTAGAPHAVIKLLVG